MPSALFLWTMSSASAILQSELALTTSKSHNAACGEGDDVSMVSGMTFARAHGNLA